MIAKSLLGTTLTSSIDTHSRLLQEHFGMTDDIVSRLAISTHSTKAQSRMILKKDHVQG